MSFSPLNLRFGMIPRETIDKIKDTMDILDVVQDFLPLKRKGANYWALSPFTNEKSPSFSVSPSKGIFKCFSSGKGGDAITFLMEVEGVSYPEALRWLAKKYGIEIAEREKTPEEVQKSQIKESLYVALEFAQKTFVENLEKHEEGKSIGLSYFRERGFRPDVLKTFGLGYSLNDWDGLRALALKKGFTEEVLLKAGLIIQKEGGKKPYDRFRGRVMFPIFSPTGRVIAFGARTLKKDDKPKYLNSPETEVYHKSDVLYGIFQAKNAIRKKDRSFIVEGYTDVISMHQAGIKNVVATSGTALTARQAKLLRRFSKNITVLFDGDEAGIKASLRGLDILLAADLNVQAAVLPGGEDPDSYIQQHGAEALQNFLSQEASDFITFKTQALLRGSVVNNADQRAEAIRQIVQSIVAVPDEIKRSVFFKQVAEKMELSEELLIREGNKIILQKERQEKRQQEREARAAQQAPHRPQTSHEAREALGLPPEPTGDYPPLPDEGPIIYEDDAPYPTDPHENWTTAEPIAPRNRTESRILHWERQFLRTLILHGHEVLHDETLACEYLLTETEEIEFSEEQHEEIIAKYKALMDDGHTPKLTDLKKELSQDFQNLLADLLADPHELSPGWQERNGRFIPLAEHDLTTLCEQVVLWLKHNFLHDTIRKINKRISSPKGEKQQMEDIMLLQKLMPQYRQISEALNMPPIVH